MESLQVNTYSEVKFLMPISAKKTKVAINGAKNDIEIRILALIEANNSVTIVELSETTNTSRRTISRILEDLKSRGV